MHFNEWLDRLPRSHLRIGDAVLPTYLVLGLAGVIAGIVGLISVALLLRLSLMVALALVPIAATTTVLLVWLRRLITRVETLVLLEQFGAVLTVSALALHLAGVAVRPYADALVVGLALFLVFGRVGCLCAGCCYGRACAVGIRYPRECGHDGRTRRLPLQLVESLVWLLLAVDAVVLAWARHDGSAVAVTLIGYGVVRLGLEPLRGDERRHWLGASEGQWLSVAAIVAGLVLAEGRRPATAVLALVGAAALLLIGLGVTARWWLALDRGLVADERAAIVALAPALQRARLGARVQTWRAGALVFAASAAAGADDTRLILSVSSVARPLVHAEATLALATLIDVLGARGDGEVIARGNGMFAVELRLPRVDDLPHPATGT